MHLLWVEVARAREEQLLRALREVQGFRTVELTESDLTQTWFRVSLPDREHILETAIEVLLSIEGFSVEIQGAMHGPIIAIVFNAVPGQTTRPRLLRRQYDRRLLHDRVSVPVSPPWALPVPPQGAPPSARPEQPGPAPPVAVPTARPRAVRRGGLGRAVQRIEDLAAERGDTQGFPRPGLWRAATQPARRALGSPRVSRVIATAIPALLVLLTVYQATLRRVFEGGPFPSSTDAMGHLYRVSYLAQEWKHWRLIPQWTPGWYMGTPLTEFYPPLVTFVMAPMAALADPALSYRVFVFVAVALAAVLTAVLFRSRLGSAGAASAGILYGLAPFVLRTVFSGGALPLALFIAIQPVLLWLLLELYRRPSATRFILAALGSAMLVLTDNQQALMLFACVGVGVAVAASVFRRRLERPAQVLAAMTVGVLLAAVWLLPAMASLDFDDTPNRGGPERPFVHSRDFSVMSPGTRTRPHDAYLGLALLALAGAGAAVARRRPFSTLLVATTGVAVFFMFGMNNPIISGVWVLQQFVFFERFLLVASLTLALLAGLLVQTVAAWLPTRVRLPLPGVLIAVAVLAVGLVDARPYFQLVRATDHDLWVASSETLDRSAPPGRLADFIGRPELSYFPATVGRDALYGWSIEGTPHAANIARLGEAIGAGHGRFVDRQLRQWWVAGAYALTDDPFASPALQTAGFAPGPAVDRGVRVTPWTRQDTASIASALTRNAVVVGRAHRQTEIVFPWANQTRTGDYAELTDDVLRDNDIIVLAEAPSSVPDAVQSRLTAFQRRGGVIIALIGNDPAVWRADVRLKRQTFSPIMTVIDRSGRVLESPVEVSGFAVGGNPWEALMVDDARAETILAFRDESAQEFPLLSRLRTADGTVYLIGGGVFAFGFAHPDEPLLQVIEKALQAEMPYLTLDHGLVPLPATVTGQNSGGMDITADAGDGHRPVLLSVTFAPHWKSITANGRPVRPRNHEGLILLDLPPGLSQIELRQGTTPGTWAGAAVSLLGACALGLVIWARPRMKRLSLSTGVRHAAAATIRILGSRRFLEVLFGPAPAHSNDAERDEQAAQEDSSEDRAGPEQGPNDGGSGRGATGDEATSSDPVARP